MASERRPETVGSEPVTDTFARSVHGTAGTMVFGGCVPALHVEVDHLGADHFMCEVVGPNGVRTGTYVAVPVSSVLYFRYDEEE